MPRRCEGDGLRVGEVGTKGDGHRSDTHRISVACGGETNQGRGGAQSGRSVKRSRVETPEKVRAEQDPETRSHIHVLSRTLIPKRSSWGGAQASEDVLAAGPVRPSRDTQIAVRLKNHSRLAYRRCRTSRWRSSAIALCSARIAAPAAVSPSTKSCPATPL